MGLSVITGAAGGMGAPCASQFAARGDALILCDFRPDALETVAAPFREKGMPVDLIAGDIAAPDFPERLLAAVGDRSIDALVHTAGLSPSMSDAARVFEVNYFATERLVDAVRPKMAKGGSVVLISSSSAYMVGSAEIVAAVNQLVKERDAGPVSAMIATPQSAYAISKRAIISLVAREASLFGKLGARITSIAPGFIDTDMSQVELNASQQMAAMIERVPLGRMGSGDEIASVALFLCSPAASYVSGCDIKVDGGSLAKLGF